MGKPKTYAVEDIPSEEVPEVQYLSDARQRLERFVDEHSELVIQYQGLMDEVLAAEQAAKSAVKDKCCTDASGPVGYNCGPIRFMRFNHKVDAGKAFEVLGEESFTHLGGRTETRVVYTIDADAVIRASLGGRIQKDVDVSRFLAITPVYTVEKL